MVKNLPAYAGNVRDVGGVPGVGTSPGEENSNPLQYSGLEKYMGRGAWQATVHWGCKESDRTEHSTQQATFTERVMDWFSLVGLLIKFDEDTAHSVSEKLNLNETQTI